MRYYGFEANHAAKLVGANMKILCLILVMSCLALVGHAQQKKVVFICEHGAAKSVIAAAYFNKLVRERNLNWEGVCRGTNPDSTLTAGTREGLLTDNLLDKTLVPKKLSYSDTIGVSKIILFTTLPDDFDTNIQTEDWSTLPGIDVNYSARRDAILKKLSILLDSLEAQK